MVQKRAVVLAGVATAAVVGLIVLAVVLSVTHNSSSSKSRAQAQDARDSSASKSNRAAGHPDSKRLRTFASTNASSASSSSSGSDSDDSLADYPDPLTETFPLTALAIGDWGRTVQKEGGSCCQRRKRYSALDLNAMEYTASLLGLAAQQTSPKPAAVLGHGDNFYWTGLQSARDMAYRFHETFESKYADASLAGVPWVNVLGNHDYGGASYLCASDASDAPAPCSSTAAMLASLRQKFALQAAYTSPNADRWVLRDHFYVYRLEDAAANVSVDVFNVDSNDADAHGARQICCQCYGYSGGDDALCEDVTRGHQYCAGGDGAMYDACMQQLQDWGRASRAELVAAAQASTATWKVVNTHYSPYNHFAPAHAHAWREVLDGLGVHVFFYGHTHGTKHDYASFRTHFVENGAGGGIQNESPSGIPPFATSYVRNVWAAGAYPYGVFRLRASRHWLELRFLTFDDKWVMAPELSASRVGGVATKHCWFVPHNGGRGRSCDAGAAAAGASGRARASAAVAA